VDSASGPNLTAATGAHMQAPGTPTATNAALGISGAAIPAAARPGVRAAGADSAASKAAPAPMDGTASASRSVAPSNAPASMAAAMARTAAEPSSAPSPEAPAAGSAATGLPAAGSAAADSSSPAGGLVMADSGVKLLDAAQANAAQANAEQAGAVPPGAAPAPAMALPMPVAPAAAAAAATAATNTQALLTRASAGAADKRAAGSAAIPSLSLTPNDGGNGAAGAAQLLANPTASTAATPAPVLKVAAPVDSAEFGQGVATQVSLMVDRNLNSASLQVNPPALGPIEVRIALQGGHAQVWFTSHSPVTRDALESSSSKLREMLGTQGFAQVSVDISQRSFQERSAQSQSYHAMPAERSAAGLDVSAQVRSAGSVPRAASGLLDAYA
jgi:flagellar hook-length control protein FliK